MLDVSPNERVTTGNVAEMFKVTILCTRDLVDELPPLPIPEPVKEPSTDAYPKKAHVLSSATTANQNAADGGARMLMSTPHLMLLPSELITGWGTPTDRYVLSRLDRMLHVDDELSLGKMVSSSLASGMCLMSPPLLTVNTVHH
ncbi:hypothetical protein DYB36_012677 [Aphanomyces astaci]|uniref:Uncharacterized protein n=1 Tax=Aphanomyces astaci TaxID=112090 RepID=A0A397B5G0_APHAT|nr:hypothetical protein DYB36_012677 [Aphanomyces astaci]